MLASKRVRARTPIVKRIKRDKSIVHRNKTSRRAEANVADVRVEGHRAFWTVQCGEVGTVIACRRPMRLETIPGLLSTEQLRGEKLFSLSDLTAMPWRPESVENCDGEVSLARIESQLYGTLFLVCGCSLELGSLGVRKRDRERLRMAIRSIYNF